MKTIRDIEVKALFNADEFLSFKDACLEADLSCSKALRDLAKGWVTQRNDKRQSAKSELPSCGHNMPRAFPNRGHAQVNYGAAHQMRRRL